MSTLQEKTPHKKIAIVTGASRRRGIGAAICRKLASQGIDLFFTYWTAYDKTMEWGVEDDEPLQLREELSRLGVRCASMEIDLSQPDSWLHVLDEATAQLGAPCILVNNACHSTTDGYQSLDAASLDAHYALNVRAPIMLSTEFARRFPPGAHGRIIHMTSGQSIGPMPGEIAYAATKGALDAFTVTFAAEVAPLGITVNAVNPGPTDSGWMSPELASHILARSPMGRLGQPEDAARLVAFLASEEAGWITGQIIHSEGGFLR
ncbi:SDR family oxidoreductase [Brevibacillus gelatini]|uniref:SDR family oxidoreductase n=1 Tax=Brevibacillus gelatini TaxID=1655277 RepID=A0A3M8B0D8_9BACL|nr:SDR family oxidoreductase [Brevibacillus gelatini]RNB56931.1 SDR family oxidoreductase [Brevibacillus gelatini]